MNLHTLLSANACTGIFRAVDPCAKAHLCKQLLAAVQANTSEARVTQIKTRLKSVAPYSTPPGILRDISSEALSALNTKFFTLSGYINNKNTFQALLSIRALIFLSWSFYSMLKSTPKKHQPLPVCPRTIEQFISTVF